MALPSNSVNFVPQRTCYLGTRSGDNPSKLNHYLWCCTLARSPAAIACALLWF